MRIDVEGRRRKGRPKQRWMDSVNVNLREKGLLEETQKRAMWMQLVRNIDSTVAHIIENGCSGCPMMKKL